MNGYTLVKAAYPKKELSSLIYKEDATYVTSALVRIQLVVKEMGDYLSADKL